MPCTKFLRISSKDNASFVKKCIPNKGVFKRMKETYNERIIDSKIINKSKWSENKIQIF